MEQRFLFGDDEIALGVAADGNGWLIQLPDGTERTIHSRRVGDTSIEVSLNGNVATRAFRAAIARTERGIEIAWNGDVFIFSPADERRSRTPHRVAGTMAAPMPGIVVEVLVTVGQRVETYQPLAVVEAMKVMATVEAPFAGTVAAVNVAKGARVLQGEVLVEITPETEL